MNKIDKLADRINCLFIWVSGGALILMMLLGFSNVLSRTFWRPIKGTFEIISFSGAVCAAMALGFAQIRKNHVGVDILTTHYSARWRRITRVVSYLISAPFFVVVARRVAAWGTTVMQGGEISETLQIAYYPVIFCVAAGFAFLALVLFFDLFKAVNAILHPVRKQKSPVQEELDES